MRFAGFGCAVVRQDVEGFGFLSFAPASLHPTQPHEVLFGPQRLVVVAPKLHSSGTTRNPHELLHLWAMSLWLQPPFPQSLFVGRPPALRPQPCTKTFRVLWQTFRLQEPLPVLCRSLLPTPCGKEPIQEEGLPQVAKLMPLNSPAEDPSLTREEATEPPPEAKKKKKPKDQGYLSSLSRSRIVPGLCCRAVFMELHCMSLRSLVFPSVVVGGVCGRG